MRVLTNDTNQPPASTPCARNAPALSSPPAPSPPRPSNWSACQVRNAECGVQNARRRLTSCGKPFCPACPSRCHSLSRECRSGVNPSPQAGAGKSDLTARSDRAVIKIDSLSSVKQAGRV